MSADDTVVIGQFPIGEVSFEYRVARIQNAEDTYEDSRSNEVIDAFIVLKFGDAEPFSNSKTAMEHATRLNNDGYMTAEYGICQLNYPRPFPTLTEQEARDFLNSYWKTIREEENRKWAEEDRLITERIKLNEEKFPREDWRYEVICCQTELSYQEWLRHKVGVGIFFPIPTETIEDLVVERLAENGEN